MELGLPGYILKYLKSDSESRQLSAQVLIKQILTEYYEIPEDEVMKGRSGSGYRIRDKKQQ